MHTNFRPFRKVYLTLRSILKPHANIHATTATLQQSPNLQHTITKGMKKLRTYLCSPALKVIC